MKKLLIYALVFGLAFTPTFGWASSVLFAGGQGQQVVYRGTVTGLRISAVDGTAFLDNLPSAVTDLVTASPGVYGVEVYDSSGRMLKGVAKAVGTEETVTDLIGGTDPTLNNGDFTVDEPSGTSWIRGTGWTISGGKGVHSVTSFSAIYQSRGGENGALLKISATFSPSNLRVYWGASGNEVLPTISGVYRTQVGGNLVGFGSLYDGDTVDNVSFSHVTAPSTAGVTIVSAKGGTTYNWQFKHASFTYNQSTNYVILKKLR